MAALSAALSVGSEEVTIFSDNMGVFVNLHKGRCPRPFLAFLCSVFRSRRFSLAFIQSASNSADAPESVRLRADSAWVRRPTNQSAVFLAPRSFVMMPCLVARQSRL